MSSIEKQAQQLRITPAVRRDWPVIEKMFADAFQTDIYFYLMKRRLDLAKTYSRFSTSIAALFAGNTYLLRMGKRPAGFIMLKKNSDKLMHLHYLAIAPEFRGQGLGRELAGFALTMARECGADIFLEAEADSAAMTLYSSLGFSADNQFHIYSLVPPSVPPAGSKKTIELIPLEDTKGMLMRAKEWLLGYQATVLAYNPQAGKTLSFRVCRPTSGSAVIIHCNPGNSSNEVLQQALPHLACHVNNPCGSYLVLSGIDRTQIDSPWLRDRADYVTMSKKHGVE
ncbi:GNAT family N-acetyltransferase [Sporomusa sphaeroides DSM 2875]|uniref:GNAT family N-acetyltransferase n=1 Tax=Sporomusa sphaeroides TaxID=47679 RepID=UPI002030AD7B|nr:GNAT family N-acetyltransferase [Sporomusa sphaeroides DSM 2875]